MTVSVQTPLNSYTANGVTTVFAFSFLLLADTDLTVEVTDTLGSVSTMTLGTHYTVSGVGVESGGSVTFLTAPANLYRVVVYRDTDLKRDTDYQDNGDLLADTLNDDVDRIWLAMQELFGTGSGAGNVLRVPAGESVTRLPSATLRASKFMGFDASGQPAMLSGTGADSALRTDLAATGGAALVGALGSGTGAILRTVQAKQRESKSTGDYTTLAQLIAAATTPRIVGANTYAAATTVGNQWVIGEKGATLTGPGVTFSTGADFYDFGMEKVGLVGTGAAGETGLTINKGHRGDFSQVSFTGFLGASSQGLRLVDAFTNAFYSIRVQGNTFGALLEQNSNSTNFFGSGFNNNTNHGALVRGSYAVGFIGCDFEYNVDGLVLGNVIASGAEGRNNGAAFSYFEGNNGRQLWIGDQPGVDTMRYGYSAFNYMDAAGVSDTGITFDRSTDALDIWTRISGTYSVSKRFLRANSRNTTIIPFLRQDLVTSAEVLIEAGATVSDQTIQYGRATIATDGAGAGFVDIVFTVPYDATTGVPPVFAQVYAAGASDPTTAAGSIRVNNLTVSGCRLRLIGSGSVSTNVTLFWRAGA